MNGFLTLCAAILIYWAVGGYLAGGLEPVGYAIVAFFHFKFWVAAVGIAAVTDWACRRLVSRFWVPPALAAAYAAFYLAIRYLVLPQVFVSEESAMTTWALVLIPTAAVFAFYGLRAFAMKSPRGA